MEDFLVKKLGRLNYQSLLHLISKNRIEIVNARLTGAFGMATTDKIYIDLEQIKHLPDIFVYFLFLHEIFHYKRYKSLGKQHFIKVFTIRDFVEFHASIVREEQSADRYGRLMFRKFNVTNFPVEYTQMLDEPYKQERYEKITRMLFGKVKNEAEFDNLFDKFIVK